MQSIALGGIPAATSFDDVAVALVRFAFEGNFFTIFALHQGAHRRPRRGARHRALRDPGRERANRRWLFIRMLPLTLVANAFYAWGSLSGALYDVGTWPASLASIAFVVGAPSGALAIATGAALALRAGGPVATALATVGRMALRTYLTQSLVKATLAYGYGFGFYGTLTRGQALGLAVAVRPIQMPVAVLYARRFRFGPAEWLWRWGTYGRRPS